MLKSTDQKYLLAKRYQNSGNLNARAQIYRFSKENINWQHWIFNHFKIPAKSYILELGCGTGALWKTNI